MAGSNEKRRRRGVVAVYQRDQCFLVIRRSAIVSAPRRICFPGGAIEDGESEAEALRRELREELNADAQPGRRLWQSVTPWGVELAWWTVGFSVDPTFEPNPAEVESIHWLTQSQLRAEPDVLESNVHFLDALARGEFFLKGISE